MFSDKVVLIVAIVVCIAVGFGLGFLSKALIDRVKIADLERDKVVAERQRDNMRDQWQEAVNELNQTQVLLNDTLAALELLREYQAIDEDTREKINELDNTLDPEGKPTEDTYDRLRGLIDEYNRKNEEYNTATGTLVTNTEEIDVEAFRRLRSEAERLYNEATELLVLFRGSE